MEKILVINPGSTSTKIAVFEDEKKILNETLRHPDAELTRFTWVVDQAEYRKEFILNCLKDQHIDSSTLTCVMARGGQVPPVPTGAFAVDKTMVDFLSGLREGSHISNIAAIIAYDIAARLHIPAYIYDPVSVDELSPVARITGMPDVPKVSRGHALNTHAVARRCAKEVMRKPVEACTFIVAHLGGGCSVWLIDKGVSPDLYSDDDGAICPERCGRIQALELVRMCYSGKYNFQEMMNKVRGNAGFRALLGTSDMLEVQRRIDAGDEYAALVWEAFINGIAKNIGDLATVVFGKVDRIILTGGIAHSKKLTDRLTEYVDWIAPVIVIAGEYEMEALAEGGLRVLRGEEQLKKIDWSKK
ncbi:MAG: butyrate kinase [Clostridiales bacterium]|jgi:butyrate kinase|nr:butyrate kinase [Clostridiales bacterium]